jgi:hypothetical protein
LLLGMGFIPFCMQGECGSGRPRRRAATGAVLAVRQDRMGAELRS